MAYTTPTVTPIGSTGLLVTFTGTDLGATSEIAITGLPRQVRLRRLKARRTAGTGTTIRPVLGKSTNPAGLDLEHQAGSAAAAHDEALDKPVAIVNGTLYYRGVWDSATDNAEAVELLLERGWS